MMKLGPPVKKPDATLGFPRANLIGLVRARDFTTALSDQIENSPGANTQKHVS